MLRAQAKLQGLVTGSPLVCASAGAAITPPIIVGGFAERMKYSAVMVFMLSAGSLLVPSLLGSTTSGWFTQTIQGIMMESSDWNTGAAFAFMLLFACTMFVSLMMRVFGVKLSDIAK